MTDRELSRVDIPEVNDGYSPEASSKPKPAIDQALGAIMNLLTSGELGPGDRLPTERDLALRLGVSRSTVREAIRGLEMMRVLQVRHGEGIFVTSLDAPLLLEAAGFAMQLMRDHEVVDLLELDCRRASRSGHRLSREHRGRRRQHCAGVTARHLLGADISRASPQRWSRARRGAGAQPRVAQADLRSGGRQGPRGGSGERQRPRRESRRMAAQRTGWDGQRAPSA